jgi:hypothetical protein
MCVYVCVYPSTPPARHPSAGSSSRSVLLLKICTSMTGPVRWLPVKNIPIVILNDQKVWQLWLKLRVATIFRHWVLLLYVCIYIYYSTFYSHIIYILCTFVVSTNHIYLRKGCFFLKFCKLQNDIQHLGWIIVAATNHEPSRCIRILSVLWQLVLSTNMGDWLNRN